MMRLCFVICALWASPVLAQSVSAILEPANQVEIRSSVNGRLDTVSASEGDIVSEGTVLATIDARVQQARVALSRIAANGTGALDRADIAIAQAKALQDRVARARSKGAAQKWEVIQTEQNLSLAEADRLLATESSAQAKGQLALEEAILSEFSMTAPFDGTILQVFAEQGEIVDTQKTIVEIGNLDQLTATAFVPLDWLDWLKVGTEINVSAQGTTDQIKGSVSSIDPRVDPASLSVRVKLDFDNADRSLLAGTPISIDRP